MNMSSRLIIPMKVVVLISLLHYVTAERMIRFIFNNGIPPTPSTTCTAEDFDMIDPLFETFDRRRLHNLNDIEYDSGTTSHHQHHHRQLQKKTKCKDNCLGYATGTCRSTGCIGYRRTLLVESYDPTTYNSTLDNVEYDDYNRELLLGTCDQSVGLIQTALDELVTLNRVSTGCRSYLERDKRRAMCYDDIIYGEVEGFDIWNMQRVDSVSRKLGTPIFTNVIQNEYTVCNTVPLNIQAVVNSCVDHVNFTISGPDNYRYNRFVYMKPMFLFDFFTFGLTGSGNYMNAGKYLVEAIPDGFEYKKKNLTLSVISC